MRSRAVAVGDSTGKAARMAATCKCCYPLQRDGGKLRGCRAIGGAGRARRERSAVVMTWGGVDWEGDEISGGPARFIWEGGGGTG
jgi:hypothetical protein